MYKLKTNINSVKGIGETISASLNKKKISTVADLILNLPLRYEDFSDFVSISEVKNLDENSTFTIKAKVTAVSKFFRNGKNIVSATFSDRTDHIKSTWFNNKFIFSVLNQAQKEEAELFISGKTNKFRSALTQPSVEKTVDRQGELADTIHTGRLVPIYSSTLDLKQGKLRRLLKEILDNLVIEDELIANLNTKDENILDLKTSFYQAHFPDDEKKIVLARERFALEELLELIQQSKKIKEAWKKENRSQPLEKIKPEIPNSIPFDLTNAQQKAVSEILSDLSKNVSMNRLLIGDVGSGKTVVAGIASNQIIKNHYHVALIAPTQILATQHQETLQKLFPDMRIELITAQNSRKFFSSQNLAKINSFSNQKPSVKNSDSSFKSDSPIFFIGTHALINKLEIINPALIIYDEQHRFGVEQRSMAKKLKIKPHILTMTATPIPRSLMLTIFSHLELSVIDELPKNRQPIKTWVVPETKRESGFDWIAKQLLTDKQALALVVCPFIDPSNHEAMENVASATETFEIIKNVFTSKSEGKLRVELLHGRLNKTKKEEIIKQLFAKKINVLVTTPIVEVGIDLPSANIIIIESAERFGLASLHQLRGRVGRAGQESYCLLFSKSKNQETLSRLNTFSRENNGMLLAELDLKNRGAGSIFGTSQSGFSSLRFASWNNLELITKAKNIATILEKSSKNREFSINSKHVDSDELLAN